MALTRATLLKRALVGGVVLTFGKLPDQLAAIPEAKAAPAAIEQFTTVRIANYAPTGFPTSARLTPFKPVEWIKDEYNPRAIDVDEVIAKLEPQSAPLTQLMGGRLNNYTAQRVEWIEDELQPVVNEVLFDRELGVFWPSEPEYVRHFRAGDIVRAEHTGECLYVDRELDKGYLVYAVGRTDRSVPQTDPTAELEAMKGSLVAAKEANPRPFYAPEYRTLVGRNEGMMSFEEYERRRAENGRRSRNIGWDHDFKRNTTPVRNQKTTFAEWSRSLR